MTRIVIDLSPHYAADLVAHLREDVDGWRHVADTIEAQLPKPKPDEPRRWLAIVEDRDENIWIRDGIGHGLVNPWRRLVPEIVDGGAVSLMQSYDQIDAVRVLSEGVTA